MRNRMIWLGLALVLLVPLGVAASSPLLQWRQPVYIAAGMAGVLALGLLLVQPLLPGEALPLSPSRARRLHRYLGLSLLGLVAAHVAGLWITSPPDVIDALLLRSATPFSAWGVVAMWALVGAALLAIWRTKLGPKVFRPGHSALVTLVAVASVVHAMLVEGTMGLWSKALLCALVLIATARVLIRRRPWRMLRRRP